MKKEVRFFIVFIFLVISLALLIWGYAPNLHEIRIQNISPTEMRLPLLSQIPVSPAINEMRRLTLEFPPTIKLGAEGGVIRLTLAVDDLGHVTSTAQIEENIVAGETIQIPDLYETHNVTAEAQLDLAGMDIQPAGAIYAPLKRGQSATFHWRINPKDAGAYRGTVWLHLGFENRSMGEKERVAVSAQIIEIRAVDFFGMSFNVARAGGIIALLISGMIGFPFLEDIIKILFNKRKKHVARA